MAKTNCYVCQTEVSLDDIAEDSSGITYDICPDCQDARVSWDEPAAR